QSETGLAWMSPDAEQSLVTVLRLANPRRMQAPRWTSPDAEQSLLTVLRLANPRRMQAPRWTSPDLFRVGLKMPPDGRLFLCLAQMCGHGKVWHCWRWGSVTDGVLLWCGGGRRCAGRVRAGPVGLCLRPGGHVVLGVVPGAAAGRGPG